ncbi:hypothetical protein STEG23_000682, partial [Scotinomys teguina]
MRRTDTKAHVCMLGEAFKAPPGAGDHDLQPKLALSLFATSHESICLAARPTHPTLATSI